MPQAFSDNEKDIIREQMHEKGKALFEKQGLKKTTIAELTQAVGISKGAFYLFYASKEELYLQILEQFEKEIQANILAFGMHPDENNHANIAELLKKFFYTVDDFPILKNFNRSDFDYLVRKIPAERLLQHTNNDKEFTNELLNKMNREGVAVVVSPNLISNLIKSLFFVGLHRDDFEKDDYGELMNVLIDLIAGHITGKEK